MTVEHHKTSGGERERDLHAGVLILRRRYDLERDRAAVFLHQFLQLLRSQHFLSVDLLDNVTDVQKA